MWILTGPFDLEHGEQSPPDKNKLLKTGKQYGIGRRDQPIQIKSKAISKNHALLVVGACGEEQAGDPNFVPTLTFHNLTDRTRPVERPSLARPRITCQPQSAMGLEDGDIVHLSASIFVRVRWERICCYSAPGKGVSQTSIKECASLGIHIVPTLHPAVTHHITPTYSLSAAIATSLISVATFVKPDWLASVLAAGHAEVGALSSLEENFALPITNKFRPSFAPSLPEGLKKYDIWEPNEERVGMLRGFRFVLVGEKGAEAQNALKEIVKRGEGEYECFAAENGREGFGKVLAKGKARHSTLVPVATKDSVIAAIGQDGWQDLVEEAKSYELKFIVPVKLIEAVVYVDNSYIDALSSGEDVEEASALADIVPNIVEDEPLAPETNTVLRTSSALAPQQESAHKTPQIAPSRKLPRRATSRTSSRASSLQPSGEPLVSVAEQVKESPPRRALVRRVGHAKAASSGDDDSAMNNDDDSGAGRATEQKALSSSQKLVRRTPSAVPPTLSRPSRLKRRVGTQAQGTTGAGQSFPMSLVEEDVLVPDTEEPPLKRFKALFDESDPDRVAKMGIEEYGSQFAGGGESLTQFEPSVAFDTQVDELGTGKKREARSGSARLGPVAEEEEETQSERRTETGAMERQTQARGTKRKSQDEDEEMEDEVPPRTKRRIGEASQVAVSQTETETGTHKNPISKVVTRVDMSQPQVHVKAKPPSSRTTHHTSVKTGEPDKDKAFLKAVASTKRGKKSEDEFDREFNNLRISKPDLSREREDEEWKVLEEFGDDGDVRGNFMVVVELPLRGGDGRKEYTRRGEGRVEWVGKPDFKKFKKKAAGERCAPIELVVQEEDDLGMGSQYWKGSSQALPPSQSHSQPKSSTTLKSTQRSTKERPTLFSESDEDEKPIMKPAKGKSQAGFQVSKPSSTQATKSGNSGTRGKTSSQRQPLFIDSDDEEADMQNDVIGMGPGAERSYESDGEEEGLDGTLKSSARSSQTTQGRKPQTRKKAPAIVVDDDSDVGVTFKTFGARGRTRRR